MNPRVTAIHDPLQLYDRVAVEAHAGETLRQVIERAGSGNWSVFLNGERVTETDMDYELKGSDVVGLLNMPADLVTIFVQILVAVISGYVAYKLLKPREEPDPRGDQGSATYAFDGIGNNRVQGYPIPIVYGTHRTGGTIISEFGSLSGTDNMILSQLVVLSEGPIEGIGRIQTISSTESSGPIEGLEIPLGIQIDEVEAQNLAESELQVRPGNDFQSAMSGFNVVKKEVEYSVRLTSETTTSNNNTVRMFEDGDWFDSALYAGVKDAFDTYGRTVDVIGGNFDSATIRLSFPQGLVWVDSNGNHWERHCDIAVRYRKLDTNGLPITTGGPQGDGYLYEPMFPRISEATRKSFLREFTWAFKNPQLSSGVPAVGAAFEPGLTTNFGELEATAFGGQKFTNFIIQKSTTGEIFGGNVTYVLGDRAGEAVYTGNFQLAGPDPMEPFLAGGWFKLEQDDFQGDPGYPIVATLIQVGAPFAASSPSGFSLRATRLPGQEGITLSLLVNNSVYAGFSLALNVDVDAETAFNGWNCIEVKYDLTGNLGGNFYSATARYQILLNGSIIASQNSTWTGAGSNSNWVLPSPTAPTGSSRIFEIVTQDKIYVDEVYWYPIGRGYAVQYELDPNSDPNFPLYVMFVVTNPGTGSPWDGSGQIGRNSIITRAADYPHAIAYLFDANTGSGPQSQSCARALGNYASDLALQTGSGTIGSAPGWVFSAVAGAPQESGEYRVDVIRVNVDSEADRTVDEVDLAAVIGISNTNLGYPGCALVGSRVRATDQLRGSKPSITAVVKGRKVPNYYGTAPAQVYSANPAWVALDILTDKRVGLGNRYSYKDVDADNIREWAFYCDELVYSGGSKFASNNTGYTVTTDLDDVLFTATTATASGFVRGSLTVYIKKTSSAPQLEFNPGDFVRLHGYPVVDLDINNGDFGGSTPGGYEVISSGVDPLNEDRNKIEVWWDRLSEGNPWSSGTLLSSQVSKDLITGALITACEPRFEFNGVFDREFTAWDALLQVCAAGRARPILVGKTVRFSVDRARDPVGLIGMASILEGSFEMSYDGPKSRPNSYELILFDARSNWDRRTEIVNDEDLSDPTQFDQFRRESVQLFGCTSRGQARREGEFKIKSNKLRLRSGKFECGPEGLSFEPGDVIYISHDILPRGVSGRVLSLNDAANPNTKFEADRDFTVESGKTYRVYARNSVTDEIASQEISEVNGSPITAGDYAAGATITLSADIGFAMEAGKTTYCIVASGDELKVEITSIKIKEDLVHEVEFLEYHPDVYTDSVEDVLPELSGNLYPGDDHVDNPLNARRPLQATGVTITEVNQRTSGDGYDPMVEVGWEIPTTQASLIRGYRVLMRRGGASPQTGSASNDDTHNQWQLLQEGTGVQRSALVRLVNCPPGANVQICVHVYGELPSTPPDYCERAAFTYRGVGPTPERPSSAALRFNENKAYYYAKPYSRSYRQQVEWRRGSWILGPRIGRTPDGSDVLAAGDNWVSAVTGATKLLAATITPLGQYSEPLIIEADPTPLLDEISFDATWQQQAWESYEDGWKTDSLPPAYDPQLSNLQRNSDGELHFLGDSLTATYTTANELIPAPRAEQIIRGVPCYIQVYWEAEQDHPATWYDLGENDWLDNVSAQWTWEGPLSDGAGYLLDNCKIECEARFSEDGVSFGSWLPFTPGLYVVSAAQFRLSITRASSEFDVRVQKFHTKISQKFRSVTDRDRMTAFIEREII